MTKEQVVKEIRVEDILSQVKELQDKGYRLVQMMCRKAEATGAAMILDYSFGLEYALVTLRISIGRETEVPSISGIYLAAFLYENEIHDLFGVKITNNAVDYKGHFYKVSIPTPFNPAQ
jgi:ech hydrogenase subunit D